MDFRRLAMLLCLAIILVWPANLGAAQSGFEFYYQAIEEVQEEKPSSGDSWWDKAKNFGKKILNYGKMAWSQAEMRFFPSAGTKWVRSVTNPTIAYKVKRVKVTTEAELLKAMGVSKESELTDGQKALLEAFRASSMQMIKDRQPYSYRKDPVRVLLTDTTGFDDVPTVEKDFWPMSFGSIQMSSGMYNYSGSGEQARSTFLHEYCHTMDRTVPAGIAYEAARTWIKDGGPLYGKDNMHHTNEHTYPRVAYLEGWAIFNEMLEFPREAESVRNAIKTIDFEKDGGGYDHVAATDAKVTGQQLMETEGVVATVLYRLATEGKAGRKAVFEAFQKSNTFIHEPKDFLQAFTTANPDDVALAVRILDEETHGKLSDAEIKSLLGATSEVLAALADRGKSTLPAPPPAPADEAETTAEGKPLQVGNPDDTNPFADR